jgi:hypothetical protein
MKARFCLALMVVATFLLALSLPVQASKTDDQIISSAQKSYVFKHNLKDDDIKIQSKDGAVTLTGSVSEESHKALARETVAGLSGVKRVDNRLEVKGQSLAAENSDAWLITKVKVAVERMKPQQGRIHRVHHAKATGCVRGVFTIRDDVPDDLRHGVFHRPSQSFQAIVRFSNSSETIDSDGNVAARGMAIKMLDVDGTPAIPGTDNRCQDFLTVNLPVFPFATPAEYVKLFEIRATPLVGDLLAAGWFALFHPRHLMSVMKIIIETVASPLVTYWSGSPYWLGPPGTTGGRAVKYSLVPRFEGMSAAYHPKSKPDDYLAMPWNST